MEHSLDPQTEAETPTVAINLLIKCESKLNNNQEIPPDWSGDSG